MFPKMSRTLPVSFAVALLLSVSRHFAQGPAIEVHFSPKQGCTDAIVKEIRLAKSTIRVQAFEFTSAPIADALVEASKRNPKVTIEVILDHKRRGIPGSKAKSLLDSGITVRTDGNRHGIAHDKVIIIDGSVVITGSFNFTKAAEERNGENILVIRDKAIAGMYADNWKAHLLHSEAYHGRE